MREDGERRSWLSEPMPNKWEAWKLGSFCLLFSLVLLSLLSLSLIKSSCHMYIMEAKVKRAREETVPVGWRCGTGVEKRRGLEKLGRCLVRVLIA